MRTINGNRQVAKVSSPDLLAEALRNPLDLIDQDAVFLDHVLYPAALIQVLLVRILV